MSKTGDQITAALQRFEDDNAKHENGNHSAGVRARKALMEIKKIAGDARKQISTAKPPKKSEEAA